MKIIRIGITGGRAYPDTQRVWDTLDRVKSKIESVGALMTLVVGDATGADRHASEWASTRGVTKEVFVAEWDRWAKQGNRNAAGPDRNKRMLDSGIDCLYAFPGGRGTAHMTNICKDAFVPVKEIK